MCWHLFKASAAVSCLRRERARRTRCLNCGAEGWCAGEWFVDPHLLCIRYEATTQPFIAHYLSDVRMNDL